jgi:tripartite-type tricarboxylate transporter receptor subunit TctC
VKSKFVIVVAVMAFGLVMSDLAGAADWPTSPVHLVVPFPPGGITDTFARLVSGKLSEALGQPIVIDNRPGAGTILATQEVVAAKPDGNTLLVGVTQLMINHSLHHDLPYDFTKQLVPIVELGDAIGLIAVNSNFPVKSLSELINLEKKQPGHNVALPGIGSPYHIALLELNQTQGTEFVSVGYKGSGQSINDVIGGHVPITVDGIVSLGPQIKAGALRALAVLSQARAPDFPNIPTTKELGMPDVVVYSFIGLFAPTGTPVSVIERVSKEVNKILALPEIAESARKFGLRLVGGSVQDTQATVTKITDTYARVIKAAKLKLQ